jgi:hypothetical protein
MYVCGLDVHHPDSSGSTCRAEKKRAVIATRSDQGESKLQTFCCTFLLCLTVVTVVIACRNSSRCRSCSNKLDEDKIK